MGNISRQSGTLVATILVAGLLCGQAAMAANAAEALQTPGLDGDSFQLTNFDLGYIADGDTLVADLVANLETETPVSEDRDNAIGMRLANGWLLGLTYSIIDTGFADGSTVLAQSIGPLYEGPMFVAKLRFR